ncbi:hypothetical protein ADEAN_000430800 [Angomonas deanei]|uniref:Uncharacterized protein n=1 Tax=Angomonas deanei TaxID=59799 RepID=A0A7G2CAE1_9TRYP|nr:hypothetical protein ADEAN_000430800 [Angomonas deanei]
MTEQNQERIFSVLKKIKDVFGDQVNNCESLLIAQCLLEHEDKLADSVPISQTPPESRHTKCARRLPERTREPLSHSSSLAAEAEGDPFDRNVNYILDICHHQFDQHDDTGEGLDPVGVMDGAVLEWLTMYEGSIHDQNARSGTLEGAEAEGTPFPEDNRTPSEGSVAEDATPSNLSCTVSTTIQFGSTMDRYEEEGTPPREEEIVDHRDEGSLPGRDSPSARQETIGSASRRSDKWKHIPEPRRNMIRKGLQAMNRTNRTESPTASVSSLRILKVTGSTNTGINSMERAKLDSKGNLSFANSAANLIKSLEPTKSRFSTDPSTSDIPLNNSKRLSCTSVASGEEYDNSASIAQIHALARELCYDVYAELYARAVDDANDEENDDDGQQNNHYPDEDTVPICSIVIQYLDPTGEKEDLFFVVGCDWPQWDYLTAGPLACACAPMPSSMDLFPTEDAYLGAQRHWRERHCLLYFLYPLEHGRALLLGGQQPRQQRPGGVRGRGGVRHDRPCRGAQVLAGGGHAGVGDAGPPPHRDGTHDGRRRAGEGVS